MQRFIREGYVIVQSALPKSYHDAMYARLEPLEEDGLVGHNNLLPMVPELGELLDERSCGVLCYRSSGRTTTCTSIVMTT